MSRGSLSLGGVRGKGDISIGGGGRRSLSMLSVGSVGPSVVRLVCVGRRMRGSVCVNAVCDMVASCCVFVEMLSLRCWIDRKSTRLNSSHSQQSRMPSSA